MINWRAILEKIELPGSCLFISGGGADSGGGHTITWEHSALLHGVTRKMREVNNFTL